MVQPRCASPHAPSQGLSSGPMIVAFHRNRLSSLTGDAEHPLGGSSWMLLKSLASRSMAMRFATPSEDDELMVFSAERG